MTEKCIYCNEALSKNELSLNMNFHAKCSKEIIKAIFALEKINKDE